MRQAQPFFSLMSPGREPGLESPSAIGRGTQWSVGAGGGLERGDGGLSGASWKGDLGLPGAAEETGIVGSRRPHGPGPERPVTRLPRRMDD